MKLSKTTVDILDNFATINQNIVIKPGSEIRTMSEARNILAETNVEETFDQTIGIYDLSEFLNILKMFDDPELEFSEKYVLIKDGNAEVRYYYADPSILTTPEKRITMPDAEVSFTLTAETLAKVKRVSPYMGNDLLVTNKDGKVQLTVTDSRNPSANSYKLVLDTDTSGDFMFCLSIKDMKVMQGDYNVELSSKLISKFSNDAMTYFIALESNSYYNEV